MRSLVYRASVIPLFITNSFEKKKIKKQWFYIHLGSFIQAEKEHTSILGFKKKSFDNPVKTRNSKLVPGRNLSPD